MHYRISFPASFAHVAPLRDLAYHAAKLQGFNEQRAERMRSIVDELCNNAIEHGSQPTSEVVLEIHADEKQFKITTFDLGAGNKMNAAQIEEKIAAGTPFENGRGRGVSMIIKGFSDAFSFADRKDGGIKACAIINK